MCASLSSNGSKCVELRGSERLKFRVRERKCTVTNTEKECVGTNGLKSRFIIIMSRVQNRILVPDRRRKEEGGQKCLDRS